MLFASPPAAAQQDMPDTEAALARSQAAIGTRIGGHAFQDRAGLPVTLGDYRGKPLVVSMIYTSCYRTCPAITTTLSQAVEQAQAALGSAAFNVVTIGFDTRADTPEAMRLFADRQGAAAPNWNFLSGDPQTVAALSDELGFSYFRSPKGWDHLTQTTIIDASGMVYRQIYGETFDAPLVVEPLKDLVLGRGASLTSVAGVINRVRLLCTVYDPAAGAYRFDYSIFVEAALGGAALATIGVFLMGAWRHRRRPVA